ncbi:related to Epoxide hydrolase 1 [Chryseobacterium sp. StRB126]|nr:related to Epoxide hydrolase 1 [Chryseobacterium sp. StRB126]
MNCIHYKNGVQESYDKEDQQEISFSEIRRLNLSIDLKPYTVINSSEEIHALYKKLRDPRYSRSAPIPILEDGEYFLVLKPKLSQIKYGDIEVEKLERKNAVLRVYYKEIENFEYAQQKTGDPILILKVFEKPKNNNNIILIKKQTL